MRERCATDRARKLPVSILALVSCIACFAIPASASAALEAHGSVAQVWVTGATPGQNVTLKKGGKTVDQRKAGALGGSIFRGVKPGSGYTVASGGATSGSLGVLTDRPAPPKTTIYDQSLTPGYGYLTTRDGTKLAVNVTLPGPVSGGPYPTLVEYSGYATARPSGPQSGIGPVANLLGYAVVEVNMRGTGCSGGAFDYFETLQSLDGYDVVETVARQTWAANGKIGMVGISYGGISQLFVGQTNPPHLAAITPLSVIDNTQTTLYPGGILNTGFALSWAKDRVSDSAAAGPDAGQPYAWQQIQSGDQVCAANQTLHPEAVNLLGKIDRNKYYKAKVADPLSPVTFVHKIKAPVFMACQWTDEQTGGHCPTLAAQMTGTKRKWFTYTNGVHTDSLDPETFNRWFDFLELYVAKRKPDLGGIKSFSSLLYQQILGVDGVTLPDDPIQAEPDYASALAAYEKIPSVRVLFDNGAGKNPYQPYPGFERSFKQFPPPSSKARSWYMSTGGKLIDKAKGKGADQFTWNPDARPATDFSGNTGSGTNGLWTDSPNYEWSQNPAGTAVSYVGSKLKSDLAVLGAGEVDVWVRSRAKNVDLQATVSEVRADGKESFVQGGWLRTDARKVVKAKSSLGYPYPDLRKSAVQTLPKGEWVLVRIPLYYQGHVYRKGSRLRVTISAPGGDQPIWAFADAAPNGTPWVAIAHRGQQASRLVLPVVKGITAPTAAPPCPGLRGEPCRDYVRLANKAF